MYIKIKNYGELETLGLTLMGASNKDGQSTIGFFGSGNKYAIATLLRKGVEFYIYSGTRYIPVVTQAVTFGGEVFDRILIDGEPTSLTTRMGPDWELWFALRELVSNAMDAGGYELTFVDDIAPVNGCTTVYIRSDEMDEIVQNLDRYILSDDYEIKSSVQNHHGNIEILEPTIEGMFNVYRKGISIYPTNEKECLFWYNFSDIDINESRTYKYDFQIKERVEEALMNTMSQRVIMKYLGTKKGGAVVYENELGFRQGAGEFSTAWRDVLKGKRIIPEGALRMVAQEDTNRAWIVPDNAARQLAEQYPELDVLGFGETAYDVVVPPKEFEVAVSDAMYRLMRLGYPVQCNIEYVNVYNEDTLAWYELATQKIFLCVNAIEESGESLDSILMEEQMHHRGFRDGSREFETFLINEILSIKTELLRLQESQVGGAK